MDSQALGAKPCTLPRTAIFHLKSNPLLDLGSGKDGMPPRGSPSDHVTQTISHKLHIIWSTEPPEVDVHSSIRS